MADDGRATLAFDLPDRDLALVLSELHWHLPEKLYPEAWRAFTIEQERRAAKGRPLPIPIPLSATIYEALPQRVQERLRPHLRALVRTTASECPNCRAANGDVAPWMTVNAGSGEHPPVEPTVPDDEVWACQACGEVFIKTVG